MTLIYLICATGIYYTEFTSTNIFYFIIVIDYNYYSQSIGSLIIFVKKKIKSASNKQNKLCLRMLILYCYH